MSVNVAVACLCISMVLPLVRFEKLSTNVVLGFKNLLLVEPSRVSLDAVMGSKMLDKVSADTKADSVERWSLQTGASITRALV